MTLGCLTCHHARFHQPVDWRPSYPGDQYDEHNVRDRIKETGLSQKLTCTLAPQWVELNTNHYCGQWTPRTRTLLQELAMTETGYRNWRDRAEAAEEAVSTLRAELKGARERSGKRLAKLRATKAKADHPVAAE